MATKTEPLRIVLAGDSRNGAAVEPIVESLGYHVVAGDRTDADLVLVGPNPSTGAVGVIDRVRAETNCPVIALLSEADEELVRQAANAGVAAYVVGTDREAWPRLIETVLRPFTELHDLEAALRRRALIERAKGILMERHGFREDQAFDLLRTEARSTNHRVVDVASAVLEGHRLLPPDHTRERGGRA
jgi:AmiR/NasT family two-component response regulator